MRITIMRTIIHVSGATVTGAVNLASFAVALGSFAMMYSGSVQTGLLVSLAALVSGAVAFVYSAWRIFRLRGNDGSPITQV
jgi:hypothetical protein